MANFKSITELPVASSSEGLNLIVNDDGAAKQIAASAVGAQADWAVTDESSPAFIKNKSQAQADWFEEDENSPAFIKNKPVDEYDLDIVARLTEIDENGEYNWEYDVNYISSFENLKEKIENGFCPKLKVIFDTRSVENNSDNYFYTGVYVAYPECGADYWEDYGEIYFGSYSWRQYYLEVTLDNSNEAYFDIGSYS